MNTDNKDNALRTPLYENHLAAGARMVDFAGWLMPLHYGSQIEEHNAVRRDAGMFDVSHMLSLDLGGKDATTFLRRILANDVVKLREPGKALYSCMLNEEGGVIDDLIVYRFPDDHYRIVVNAATADGDVAWMRKNMAPKEAIQLDLRRDLTMIAIQGPRALERSMRALPKLAEQPLPLSFHAIRPGDLLIARTGYTGEDGLEIAVPSFMASEIWEALRSVGVRPCGLGARDTLRLEAGMNLYGQDMDETSSPFDTGLAWTVDLKDTARSFIGKEALLARGTTRRQLGLVLEDKGVLRPHMKVLTDAGEGETTSGSFSPTLGKSIAFARLPLQVEPYNTVQVEIRGKQLQARTVRLPFVRHGQAQF